MFLINKQSVLWDDYTPQHAVESAGQECPTAPASMQLLIRIGMWQ